MLNITPISFRGSESAGSIGKIPEPQNGINSYRASFRGAESTGSIGKCSNPSCPDCDTVSFRGKEADVAKKSGCGFGTLLLAGLGTVVSFGLLHKKGVTEKMGEGKFANIIKSFSEKCYDFCHNVKTKITGLFSKKS